MRLPHPGPLRGPVLPMKAREILLAIAALLCTAASAGDPAERLADPAREAHARALFREIRCLVCQNESIDDSEAPLAEDLRRIVRQQVSAGRPDSQVRRYLTDRYGEFVLLKPSFSPGNAALWIAPFALLGLGGALLILTRRRDPSLEAPLSPAEEARLSALADPQSTDMLSPQRRPENVSRLDERKLRRGGAVGRRLAGPPEL